MLMTVVIWMIAVGVPRTMLDKELGKGQGVSDLIERSSREPSGTLHSVCPEDRGGRRALSPVSARTEQLRQTTFSMTLDFIERLTMSSAKLAKYSRVLACAIDFSSKRKQT